MSVIHGRLSLYVYIWVETRLLLGKGQNVSHRKPRHLEKVIIGELEMGRERGLEKDRNFMILQL